MKIWRKPLPFRNAQQTLREAIQISKKNLLWDQVIWWYEITMYYLI